MNHYNFSWDVKDANSDELRLNLVALILRIDPLANINQPLWSSLRITSLKTYDVWINSFKENKLDEYVYFTFSQIVGDEQRILHSETPKLELNDSLNEKDGIIDQAKKVNKKRVIKTIVKQEVQKLKKSSK